MAMEWDEWCSVEVAEFDRQHKEMFDQLTLLNSAVGNKEANKVVAEILDSLFEYTRFHFSREEELMREHDYPDFPLHKDEHELLLTEVSVFREKFENGDAPIRRADIMFLLDWLEVHLFSADMRYKTFFHKRGVR